MNTSSDPDRRLDENLDVLGRNVDVPAGPSAEIRDRCLVALRPASRRPNWSVLTMLRKPSVLSALGAAAMIVVVASIFFPTNGSPEAMAATVIQKLNEQIGESNLFEVRFDQVTIEEAYLDGRVQIGEAGIAGDLNIVVQEGDPDEVVKVDVALGLSEASSWVLVRRLEIPDPEAQMLVNMMFPAGTETLVMLPENLMQDHVDADVVAELHHGLSSEQVLGVLKELIASHEQFGATVEEQADGTILLTLPIADAAVLESLEGLIQQFGSETVTSSIIITGRGGAQATVEMDEGKLEASRIVIEAGNLDEAELNEALEGVKGDVVVITQTSEPEGIAHLHGLGHLPGHGGPHAHDSHDLIGSTVSVVYDPDAELVRSVSIRNLAGGEGAITVNIGQGDLDATLLDPERFKTPATRVLDLGALHSFFESHHQAAE